MEIFFAIFFVLFFCAFFFILFKNLARWHKNNTSPRLTVPAKVVSKRVSHSHDASSNMSYSRYFVTFEVESGDRMELKMHGSEYGLLVEGDFGRLTFQGTRYLSFERGEGEDLS